MDTVCYPQTPALWPDKAIIAVQDVDAQQVAVFSCDFLLRGHVYDWVYILDACRTIVSEQGTLMKGRPADGSVICLDRRPKPGQYYFIRSDDFVRRGSDDRTTKPVTFAVGPRLAVFDEDLSLDLPEDDSMSFTSLSSSQDYEQDGRFHQDVAVRDGLCLITENEGRGRVVLTHIVPANGPERYEEVFRT